MSKTSSSFLIMLFLVGFLNAQENPPINPDKAFANENFKAAIKGYKKQLISRPQDYQAHLQLGKCYINTFGERGKALFHLEKIKDRKDNNFEVLYYLGRAYHLNYNFVLAISTYSALIDSTSDARFIKNAQRQIEMCNNAIKLTSSPVNVTLRNMGDTINSSADDYNAFIDQTESIMVFSSKRKKRNKAEAPFSNGEYTSDIFLSYYEEGAWQKIKSQSNVSTPENEEIVGLSADGKLMFYNSTSKGALGEMVVSKRKSGSFKEPIMVEKTINSSAFETTASVSNSRQKFFYGSNREGGVGQFDLYWANRLPDVNWAKPQQLGAGINTEYNELYPQLSPDEKTLYFSSEGHNSMGGYDLFKCDWDPKNRVWGPPQNLGCPINTPDDDMHIAINAEGSMGYVSTWRKDSRGGLDIYSISFNDAEVKASIITGNIITTVSISYHGAPDNITKTKTTAEIQIKEALLDVYNSVGDLVGTYLTNPSSGKFVLVLPPGKYSVELLANGYKETKIPIVIYGKRGFERLISKNFTIKYDGTLPAVSYKDLPQ